MRNWVTSNNFVNFTPATVTASLFHKGWTPMLVKTSCSISMHTILFSIEWWWKSVESCGKPWNLPTVLQIGYSYIGFYPPKEQRKEGMKGNEGRKEWRNEPMNESMSQWISGSINEKMNAWTNAWTNAWANAWIKEGKKAWLNDWINECTHDSMKQGNYEAIYEYMNQNFTEAMNQPISLCSGLLLLSLTSAPSYLPLWATSSAAGTTQFWSLQSELPLHSRSLFANSFPRSRPPIAETQALFPRPQTGWHTRKWSFPWPFPPAKCLAYIQDSPWTSLRNSEVCKLNFLWLSALVTPQSACDSLIQG